MQEEGKLDTEFLFEKDSPYEPYRHQSHVSEIVEGLFVGDIFAAYDLETLQEHKITAILNLTYNIPNNFPKQFTYRRLPIEDHPQCDISQYFEEACKFIAETKGNVLVHCSYGLSRSPTIAAAYLILHRKMTATVALGTVRSKRRQISPNETCLKALEKLGQAKASIGVSENKNVS